MIDLDVEFASDNPGSICKIPARKSRLRQVQDLPHNRRCDRTPIYPAFLFGEIPTSGAVQLSHFGPEFEKKPSDGPKRKQRAMRLIRTRRSADGVGKRTQNAMRNHMLNEKLGTRL